MSTLNEKFAAILMRILWMVALMIWASSIVIAGKTGDGHWVNRGGAVIAALAAGAILVQINEEIRLDDLHEKSEAQRAPERSRPSVQTPIERIQSEIVRKKAEREAAKRKAERHRARLLLAWRVAVIAIAGELLHGFGDLAICGWLVICKD